LKAIILDIDGTLIDSMAIEPDLYFSSISAVLGSVEIRENLNDYDHVTDSGIIAQVMEDNALPLGSGAIESIRNRFVASLAEHIETDGPFPEIPGAARFINRLRDSKEHELNVKGIPVFSCDDSPSRTEIMRIALSQLGNMYESVTYFGDAEWDRRACETLGWEFVPVGSGLGGIETYDNFAV